jgi:hypothetical protein
MTNSDNDHVLPNGNTFLASTASGQGYWAKATDPITAIKEVRRQEGSHWPKGKVPIAVWYGDAETLNVSRFEFGGVSWDTSKPYIPIGLFTVTERSINPLKKSDFEEGGSHEKWMAEELSNVQGGVAKRKKRRAAFEENVEEDPAVQELIAEST